jgi:hypothetical protein
MTTVYTEQKYKEISEESIDILGHITDINKAKKLAMLLRTELYRCDANIESLESERDHYKKGYDLSNTANISLIRIIRTMNLNNLDAMKAQVEEMFPESFPET